MATGVVKWFSLEKGFGFISEDGGLDVFVQLRSLQGSEFVLLREGQRVRFDIEQGPDGHQAAKVQVLAS